MLQFYGYKKCSTCRKAEAALTKLGLPYEFIDITSYPPSEQGLRTIRQSAQVETRKLFNTSGEQYKALGMKDKLPDMSEAEVFKLLSGNGRLIKRPLVSDGKRSTVGFDEKSFTEIWRRK